MKTYKLTVAMSVALTVLGLGAVAQTPAPQSSNQGSRAPRGSILFLENCQTFWEDERVISSKIPGKIDRRHVKDGDMVTVDQELAHLDDRDARIEHSMQKKIGESELAWLAQTYKLNEYQARKAAADRLWPSRAISEEEWRLAKVNVDVNEVQSRQELEKREIEQMKAERAQVFLDDHMIRSPMRGIIKKCFKREQESVTASDLQMFHIISTDRVWVEGWAPVSYLYRVRVGQGVDVHLAILEAERTALSARKSESSKSTSAPIKANGASPEAVPSEALPQERTVFKGNVEFIDPDADFGSRRFRIRAEVRNQYDSETKEPILRAGLNANMTIFLDNTPANKGNQ